MSYQVTARENKNLFTRKVTSVSFFVLRADGSLYADCGHDNGRAERVCDALNRGEDEGAVAWAY